jgi:antitoxin (DNA-binding transcriptional repressor) of toxin-antitoxin stability system
MFQLTPDEAKSHLEELIEAAMRGEQVLIGADKQHAVQLVPVTPPTTSAPKHNRHAGTAKGMIVVADDFDAPLADFDAYTR